MQKINVLSLFDGISCGRVAIDLAGVEIKKYFASEIDPYAIKVALKNYDDTQEIGDIKRLCFGSEGMLPGGESGAFCWTPDEKGVPKIHFYNRHIDLIMGGSPCQDLSTAKKDGKGLKGEKSSLFFYFAYLVKKVKPRYFLLENVASMKKADRDIITKTL